MIDFLKHAYAVYQHRHANQSVWNRRAHLMDSRPTTQSFWVPVPFEHIVPGNIVKVEAEEYGPFAQCLMYDPTIVLVTGTHQQT